LEAEGAGGWKERPEIMAPGTLNEVVVVGPIG